MRKADADRIEHLPRHFDLRPAAILRDPTSGRPIYERRRVRQSPRRPRLTGSGRQGDTAASRRFAASATVWRPDRLRQARWRSGSFSLRLSVRLGTALIPDSPTRSPRRRSTVRAGGVEVIGTCVPSAQRSATSRDRRVEKPGSAVHINGERALRAIGSVAAGVDFTGIEYDVVEVSDDGKSVTLSCRPPPSARPSRPRALVVYSATWRDRPLQSLFRRDDGVGRSLTRSEEIWPTPPATHGLLARAERNTRLMLEGCCSRSGSSVAVRFPRLAARIGRDVRSPTRSARPSRRSRRQGVPDSVLTRSSTT